MSLAINNNENPIQSPKLINERKAGLVCWYELYNTNRAARARNLKTGVPTEYNPLGEPNGFSVFSDGRSMDSGFKDAQSFTIFVACAVDPDRLGDQVPRILFNLNSGGATGGISMAIAPKELSVSGTLERITFFFDGVLTARNFDYAPSDPPIMGQMRLFSITRTGSNLTVIDHTIGKTWTSSALAATAIPGVSNIILGNRPGLPVQAASRVSFYSMYQPALTEESITDEVSYLRTRMASNGVTI